MPSVYNNRKNLWFYFVTAKFAAQSIVKWYITGQYLELITTTFSLKW